MINNNIGNIDDGLEFIYINKHYYNNQKSIMYIGSNDKEIIDIEEKLKWFLPNKKIFIFKSWDNIPYDAVSPNINIQSHRIRILNKLTQNKDKIILLISTSSLIQKVPFNDIFENNIIDISKAKLYNFSDLISKLINLGYKRTSLVNENGEFSVRGSIIDIFLANYNSPLRIDFFDNKIESIKLFDPVNQKSFKNINYDNIKIFPTKEIILSKEKILDFKTKFRKYFNNYRASEIYNNLNNLNNISGIENFLPLFHKKIVSIFDYLNEFDIILKQDFNDLISDKYEQIHEFYNARINNQEKFNLHPSELYFSYDEIKKKLLNYNIYNLNKFSIKNGLNLNIKFQQKLSSFKKELDNNFIKQYFNANSSKKIIVCTKTDININRIKKFFFDNLSINLIELDNFSKIVNFSQNYFITILSLENSLIYEDYIFLNEKTIFGYNLTSFRKSNKNKYFLDSLSTFTKNSILVHSDYGFCKFNNIVKLKINEYLHECIELEFYDKQKLYLPIENSNLISKYSNDPTKIILDKLSGTSWFKRKLKVKRKILEIADFLIKNAAKRFISKSPKIIFNNIKYEKFSSTFPHIETEDQMKTFSDIIDDFSKDYPTDRLVIGDVAYGKSEVIIRAIFLAAQSSVQSLVLVPTTLLARQHYINFLKRLSIFNIKINHLSRLISKNDKKNILKDLESGKIDCVIGTHILLSDKLKFKNLGLIIIDEEQHFGVRAKEKLKKLSSNSHIISLSATPIPRTLQLSLSGVKELSLILTPPYNRLSIRTYISPFDKTTIKEAIKREIYGRKGGVFWVTPRKKDIPFLENFIKEELPEIKYNIAHGKLNSDQLEKKIAEFYNNEVPLLISTNIIESGLDLPNVNTIIIHRANMFGLSQLHQLRGRVGRSSNIRGYAYLTYNKNIDLNDTSTKRLKIINTFDQIGSGFNIASSDMDLRGSGNLLGVDQSGFVKEVGLELYNKLLEEEIYKLKNKIFDNKISEQISFEPKIKIPESIFIPDTYINDIDVKLQIYKKIVSISNNNEKEDVLLEIRDRFGILPIEVKNLFKVIEIKILCYQALIDKVEYGKNAILIKFYKNKPKNFEKVMNLSLNNNSSNFKIRPDNMLIFSINHMKKIDKFELIKKIISQLV
ncbi:MAG: Transcription-repair-coupling factor [Alphaproteobacteria bacterium MarineAlpha5_Bin9]|nr:MAG: Transcription-repair-coupling factor [Alphaproteobacteria bacterium MarineAlpha5_Bin9]|tara:strand:- start:95 stop:3481 length:3387 start_codon:yes stop_codon:yes gene_type:complete